MKASRFLLWVGFALLVLGLPSCVLSFGFGYVAEDPDMAWDERKVADWLADFFMATGIWGPIIGLCSIVAGAITRAFGK